MNQTICHHGRQNLHESFANSLILQVIIVYKSRLVNIGIIKRLAKFYKQIWAFLLKMWQFFVTNKKQSQHHNKI